MKKPELLAPAGNMESLKAAIAAGCDAIYLSGKKYGARAFANNFNNEELEEAIKLCHLYGIKVYITVNTLIYEDEVESLLSEEIIAGKLIKGDIPTLKLSGKKLKLVKE